MGGNVQFSTFLTSQDSTSKTRGPQAGHTGGEKMILTIDIRNTIRPGEIKIPNLHYQHPNQIFFLTNIRILIETNVYT